MKTKKNLFVILALILILNLASVQAANYGGDLKVKVNQRPFNLNPIYAVNETALMINKQIFDTLVIYNDQGKLTANLADSWEIKNNSTIFEFQLKEEVNFHPYKINGKEVSLNEREVDAEDWKWSFEYLAASKNKSPYADLLAKVEGYEQYRQGEKEEITGIKVKDKYRLEIELKEAYAPFIYNLAQNSLAVMPAEAVQNSELNFSTAPVGTGSFKYRSFTNNQITLIKNDNYWKNNLLQEELPYLNQIEINFGVDHNLNADLQDFDLYQLNSAEFSTYQQQNDNFTSYQIKKLTNNYFYFVALNYNSILNQNSNSSDFKESLRFIINENDFIETLNFNNFIIPADSSNNQLLPKKISENMLNLKNYSRTSELENLKLATNNSKIAIQISEVIKNKLKAENIDLEVEDYRWPEYLNHLNNKNIKAQLFIMSTNYNNRFEFIKDNFYSTSMNNYFGYQSQRLDNLIDYLKIENNEQSREKAFEIITDILINDNPFVLLFQGADSYLYSEKIGNQDLLKDMHSKYNFERLYFK